VTDVFQFLFFLVVPSAGLNLVVRVIVWLFREPREVPTWRCLVCKRETTRARHDHGVMVLAPPPGPPPPPAAPPPR
jgi:hypothetical protein